MNKGYTITPQSVDTSNPTKASLPTIVKNDCSATDNISIENHSTNESFAIAHPNADSTNAVIPTNFFCNKKTASKCCELSGNINTNYQSNHQGCYEGHSIIDGKPPGLESHDTCTSRTQEVAHESGLPGVETSGNDLTLSGNFRVISIQQVSHCWEISLWTKIITRFIALIWMNNVPTLKKSKLMMHGWN